MKDVQQAWRTIEDWFAKEAPGALILRPPASAAQIEAAEAAFGRALPDDYKASLLIHDGQEPNEELSWLPAQWLAPLDACLAAWQDQRDFDEDDPDLDDLDEDEKVRGVLSHPSRFPVMGSELWDYDQVFLDYIPGPSGADGQLVALVSECDFELVAGSFAMFLGRYAELLEGGKLQAVTTDSLIEIVATADERHIGAMFSADPP